MKERERAQRDNEMYPDEIDTPKHISARTRFQRYRGLKSFRTSPWDPYENLPEDYAKIFQFENFNATSKRIEREGRAEGVSVSLISENSANNIAWIESSRHSQRRAEECCRREGSESAIHRAWPATARAQDVGFAFPRTEEYRVH